MIRSPRIHYLKERQTLVKLHIYSDLKYEMHNIW